MMVQLRNRGAPYRPHSVLVIEDDQGMRDNILELLENEGFEASGVGDGARGVAAATAERPSLILCDLGLPVLDGYGVLREIRARPETRSTPFILLTASGERAAVRTGMTLGADDYLTKPFARRELLGSIEARLRATAPSPAPAPEGAGPLVAEDPKTRALFELATQAGRSCLPVLVTGEAGVGKSTLATHLHRAVAGAQPLYVVRCGEAPTLVDCPPGSSTVLLDDLDELSAEGQRALLKLMDVHGRAGVRFFATARTELARLADEGRFRWDLLHRVDGFRLHVPPLRERPLDILPLATRVLARYRAELSERAASALSRYPFPGNVRELESGLERAAVLAGAARVPNAPSRLVEGVCRGPGDDAPKGTVDEPRVLVRRAHLGVMAGAEPPPLPAVVAPRARAVSGRMLGCRSPRPLRPLRARR